MDEDERHLLRGAADDLAFALYSIDQERIMRQAEAQLQKQAEAQHRFERRLRRLVQVGSDLALTSSVDELLRGAVQLGTSRLGFDRMGIWLRCGDDGSQFCGSYGIDERGQLSDERGCVHTADVVLAQWMDAGRAQRVFYEEGPLTNGAGDVVGTGAHCRALLWQGDHDVGFIAIDNLVTHTPISPRDQDLLRLFATIVTNLYTRRSAIEQEQRRAAQQAALNAVITRATSAVDLDTLLKASLPHTLTAMGVEIGGCWLLDHDAVVGIPSDLAGRIHRRELSDGAVRDPLVVHDWARSPATNAPGLATVAADLGLSAMVVVHIGSSDDDRPLGALLVASSTPRRWSDDDVGLLDAIGRQLGSAAQRLQLLERIRQQAQRLERVMDAVPDGVVVLNAAGDVLLANPQGHAHLALLGAGEVDERLEALGDLPLTVALAPPRTGHWHEARKEGRTFEVVSRPLRHADDAHDIPRSGGWVLVLRDVTDDRAVLAQLQQQERLAAVGRLAAGIAHDFNNIVAVIVLYAQMALRQSGLSSRLQEQLRIVTEQAYRATELVEQILDFSRKSTMEMHSLSIVPYMKEISKLLERTLPEDIRINVAYEQNDLIVSADPTRIQQALMNLATNARDAMPRGGEISIHLARVSFATVESLPVATMATGPWVRMDFADTGDGIAPEVLPHIFEPFYTTKQPGKGSGLGLAQVHGIVKQHGGEVLVTSHLGAGTTFTILLPCAVVESPDHPVGQSRVGCAEGGGQLILVVEDNPRAREAVVAALTSLGYETLEAEDGRVALNALAARGDEIKLILSDAVMPEMGGVGLLSAMRDCDYRQPVIVLSGYLPPDEQEELRSHDNFVTWLTKPVDLAGLSDAVAAALAAR